jgi:hypothetical protein
MVKLILEILTVIIIGVVGAFLHVVYLADDRDRARSIVGGSSKIILWMRNGALRTCRSVTAIDYQLSPKSFHLTDQLKPHGTV